MIAMLLGGRVAEEIVFGEVTTGAENDLRETTKIARKMVTEFGMSDKLGPVTYGEKEELVFLGKELGVERNYSDKIATLIDEETRAIIEKAYTRAQELLKKYRDILDKLAEKLLKEETVEGREFEELFKDLKLPLKEPAIT